MTKNFTLLFLFVVALSTAVIAQTKQYNKALNAYGRGSFASARNQLQKIDNPDVPSRLLMAKVLYQLGEYDQIKKVLSGLEHLDHDARIALATSYHVSEEYEKARALWKTLLDEDDRAVIFSNIGDTFYNSGNIDSSLVYIEKALTLDPNSDLYTLNLGITYAAMEESAKACAHFFLSAQRENTDASEMYETENCVSWQHQWLDLVPGRHVSQLSNMAFPALHHPTLSVNERVLLKERGDESIVTLTDIVTTDVGAVLTFQGQEQELIHRWVEFRNPPSFTLGEIVAATAGR